MLIYCEGCGARYQIDVNRLSSGKPKGKCSKCSKIIDLSEFTEKFSLPEEDDCGGEGIKSGFVTENVRKMKSSSMDINQLKPVSLTSGTGFRIIVPFIVLILLAGAGIASLYLGFVPGIISNQISLRAQSISRSFSAGVLQPLMLRNYLAVNKTASMHADFPDVAYVAVLNQKNLVVAGIMNKKDEFSQEFKDRIEKNGFPMDMLTENEISAGSDMSVKDIKAGGRIVHDAAVRIPDSLGIVHVGLFKENAEKEINGAFWPVIILLGVFSAAGIIVLFVITKSIVVPIHRLTRSAQKIALGNTNEPIKIQGKGEIEALSTSLEMMRQSINMAIVRLRRKNNS